MPLHLCQKKGVGMGAVLSIDMGGTSIKWAVISDEYELLERGQIPTRFSSANEVVEALVSVFKARRWPLEGIGVSAPGSMDGYDVDPSGTIRRGGMLPYMDACPLGRLLQERCGLVATIENDGKCCALGEYAAGALRNVKVGVVLAIGTAIGGGIIVDGKVLRGAHAFAGEFSFLSNNVCEAAREENMFGMTGGWKALRGLICDAMSREGIIKFGAIPEEVDGVQMFEWICQYEAAEAALKEYATRFDRSIMNIQAVVDPEVFAIAGGISAHDELIDALVSQLPVVRSSYSGIFKDVPMPKVVRAQLGNDANLCGAAFVCREALRGRQAAS